jgi:hypothetical protein
MNCLPVATRALFVDPDAPWWMQIVFALQEFQAHSHLLAANKPIWISVDEPGNIVAHQLMSWRDGAPANCESLFLLKLIHDRWWAIADGDLWPVSIEEGQPS